ncbi:MAG: SH3 domain-containing protein, partial [Chloroflexota bacterium]
GLFLTCSTFGSVILICLVCALSGVVSISLNNVAQELAREEVSLYPVRESDPNAPQVVIVPEPSTASNPPALLPVTGERPTPPIVTATQGRVNLRGGPGTSFEKVGLLPQNESLEIIGQSQDRGWWLVSTRDGLAWIYDGVVSTNNLHSEIPIVDVNVQTVSNVSANPPVAATAEPAIIEVEDLIPGTPTPQANTQRILADQTVGLKRLLPHLASPPMSKSFSPNGDTIAIMEGVKLHLVAGDGSYSRILLDSQENIRLKGDGVWSPSGEHIAFSVEHTCPPTPCTSVGMFVMATEEFFLFKTVDNMDASAPRWTQKGKLLVNVHPSEPASGIVYLYDISGRGLKADGMYQLSTSHEGQKWYPWHPGRSFQIGISERPDSFWQ